MNRQHVAYALARHAGKPLTQDAARAILDDLFPDHSIDPADFAPAEHAGYTLQLERFEDTAELRALQRDYAAETHPGEPYSLDAEVLAALARAGGLATFTARRGAELVGVMRVFLLRNERTGLIEARDNLFFIYPGHRGRVAVALWRYAERCMFDHGVRSVVFTALTLTGAGRMAKFLGYQADGTRYRKTAVGTASYDTLPTRHHRGQA